MEILESIIHPQSIQRIELLSYLATISYMILLPYLGLLLSSTLLSCMFNGRGKKYKNSHYIKLSKDLISIPTFNLFASLGIVLFPLLSIMFVYAQIVQTSSQLVFDNLFFIIFLIVPAVLLIYTYKDSFELADISRLVNKTDETESKKEEFSIYKFKSIKLLTNSSRIAFYLLFASSYILIAGITLISDSSRWETSNSISSMLFNEATLISFLYFFSTSFALTSILALYLYFKPNSNNDESNLEYQNMVKKFFQNTAMIFLLVQPILYTVDLMSVPKVALSNSLFGISILVMITLLLIVTLLYQMIKNNHLKYRGVILFLFIGLFALLSIKVQVAFNTSAQLQVKEIISVYDAKMVITTEQLGIK
ncbi:MAG: hypothetical protein KKF62_17620 [Bacteroidetes bacterium]|nr:hypothetical protein [Bacteroidota bacterium]MBU1114446.1 hypothetical protein [Bacteroidota bacterium]MBU1799794.1 hypothetical protein [Bacteroidota bacterium]